MKLGIIRCQQTEDVCPGTTDFVYARENKGAFAWKEPIEIVGFVSCGGCPGKKAVFRAKEMVKRGAETIVFASCISKGTPLGFVCPHWERIKAAVVKALPENIGIVDFTH